MKMTVYNQEGAIVGSQDLSDKVFGVKVKKEVVHQVAVAMFANRRQVLAHTKDRGEVRGGGRKPWRQKGTGRARHGSIRSPLWVGGGVTFGPTKDRNFKQKINTKMRRKAIAMCLSDRVNDDKFVLLDKFSIKDGKTKEMVSVFEKLREVFYGKKLETKKLETRNHPTGDYPKGDKKLETKKLEIKGDVNKEEKEKMKPKKVLVLLSEKDEKVQRTCRNIPWLTCARAQDVNVLDVLANEFILTSVGGVKRIEENFEK